MLVITRREGQSLSLDLGDGREVVVQLTTIAGGGAVVVGIDAPESVSILRGEILECVGQADRLRMHAQRTRLRRLVADAGAAPAEASS